MLASRRRLLSLSAAAAAGAGLAACGGGNGATSPAAAGLAPGASRKRDVAIVNFLLTLEYVEAQLFDKAVHSGAFAGVELDLMKRFREHEHSHAEALTAAVGKLSGTPVVEPRAKFAIPDRLSALKVAYRLENLAAAAYLGQVDRIADAEILAAMLSILAAEARHATALNTILEKDIAPTGAFAAPATLEEARTVLDLFIAR